MTDLHDNPICNACPVQCQMNHGLCEQTAEFKLAVTRANKEAETEAKERAERLARRGRWDRSQPRRSGLMRRAIA